MYRVSLSTGVLGPHRPCFQAWCARAGVGLLWALGFVLCMMRPLPAHAADGHPLAPLDTSSPRATLGSFLSATDELGRLAAAYREQPTRDHHARMAKQLHRVRRLLDLSSIPPTAQREVGSDAVVMLMDVMGRIELPAAERVPDEAAMKARADAGAPPRWGIPNTEIEIARVKEGERAGEYLFSPATVARVNEFQAAVADQPYRRPMSIEQPWRLAQLWGGWLLPPKAIDGMPDWLKSSQGDQVVWKWLAQLATLSVAFALVWGAHRWSRRVAPGHKVGEQLRSLAVPVAFLLLVPLLAYVTRAHINVTGLGAQFEQVLVPGLTYLALAWLIWQAAIFAAELIISSPRIPDQGLDAHLLRLMARVLGLIGVVAVLMWGGNRLGLPLYGLIAGVSIGGLAVALAAQGTVENFIGSLNLFADRPVRIGETCRYGDDVGTVEEIGLRSTRLRGPDRTVTTVPNADFSKMKLVNLSRRDRLLSRTTLGLRYETTPDQLRYLLTRLREMLAAHPRVAVDTPRVRFVGFGDFALNVEMQAYVATADFAEFLAVQEDIFLRTIDLVAEAGSGFAFPSQTLYLSRDGGIDPAARRQAQDQVDAWRQAGTLPFPNLAAADSQRLKGTLDWPPRGAPSLVAGAAVPDGDVD